MKTYKTLREVCTLLGVSRRAVQGYEFAGMLEPVGRNKYGHLLYDEETMIKITVIRHCQQMGFTIKEIKSLLESDSDTFCACLKQKNDNLRARVRELQLLIEKTEKIAGALRQDETITETMYRIIKEEK